MFFRKRALALRLGLFIYFCNSLAAQSVSGELSAGTGTLWVEDEGAAYYWHSGVTLALKPKIPSWNFYMGFDVGQFSSTLPWMNASAFGYVLKTGFDTQAGGITAAFGSFSHSFVKAVIDKMTVSNDKGHGFFVSLEAPMRFGFLRFVPGFLYGGASWGDGDMYWFFGKSDVPSFSGYGLDICFVQPYFQQSTDSQYTHGPGFRNYSLKLNIVSNEKESLFNTRMNAVLFFYRFSFERPKIAFNGTLGWLYANASLDGALTSFNQPYFLFPFLFFNVKAQYKAHAGYAMSGFRYNHGIFRYNFDLGIFHIFFDNGGVELNYKMKKLFDGEEFFEEMNSGIGGLGAAFLLLDAAAPALPLHRNKNTRLSLGLRKAFIVPWGYEKLFPADAESSVINQAPQANEVLSLVKTVLLSGLSIYGSISW
jgi:hypothetical protein